MFCAVVESPGSGFVEEELFDDGRPADAEGSSFVALVAGEITSITRVLVSREDKGGSFEGSNKVFNVSGSPVVETVGESVNKVGKGVDVLG